LRCVEWASAWLGPHIGKDLRRACRGVVPIAATGAIRGRRLQRVATAQEKRPHDFSQSLVFIGYFLVGRGGLEPTTKGL
jgi:hypothetical protein